MKVHCRHFVRIPALLGIGESEAMLRPVKLSMLARCCENPSLQEDRSCVAKELMQESSLLKLRQADRGHS